MPQENEKSDSELKNIVQKAMADIRSARGERETQKDIVGKPILIPADKNIDQKIDARRERMERWKKQAMEKGSGTPTSHIEAEKTVRVMRSNGEIEDGWKLVNIVDGSAIVTKKDRKSGKLLRKVISEAELEMFNAKDFDKEVSELPKNEEPVPSPQPELEPIEGSLSEDILNDARQKYAEEYKKFMASAGKLTKWKRALVGVTVKDSKIPPELKKLEEDYNGAAVVLGREMYDKKFKELELDNLNLPKKLYEERVVALEQYKQKEIFTKIIIQEQEELAKLEVKNLPPKEKGIVGKSWNWYLKQPRWKKLAMTTALSVGVFAIVAPGTIAAAGGLTAFATIRAVRGIAGSVVGQTAAKSIDWLFKDKSTERRIQDEKDLAEEFGQALDYADLNHEDIKHIKDSHAKALKFEQMSKKARILAKAGVGLFAGGLASAGAGGLASAGADYMFHGSTPEIFTPGLTKPGEIPPQTETPSSTPEANIPKAPSLPNEMPTTKPGVTLENAVVHKGQGIENAFIKQIETNPKLAQDLGFKGDINDTKALHLFAGNEAHNIALKTGYADAAGNEIRVTGGDKVAYELKMENGKIVVDEKSLDGKIIETHHEGDKFETKLNDYEYKKGAPVVENKPAGQHQVEYKHTPLEQHKIETIHQDLLEKYNRPQHNIVDHSSQPDHITKTRINEFKTGTTEFKTGTTVMETGTTIKTGTEIRTGVRPTTETMQTPKGAPTPEEIKAKVEPITQKTIIDTNPKIKGTPFEQNSYKLSPEQLNKVYETHTKNINFIASKNDWGYEGPASAKNFVGTKPIENDALVPYLNKLLKLTGEKPTILLTLTGPKDETVEQYMTRVLQIAVQRGTPIDQLQIENR
ncbi:MAG: hypothetical protein KGL67_00475 [Patescibacteria group bacterium]|nr:hypothetical protein [Patescibacteria group bacterium]